MKILIKESQYQLLIEQSMVGWSQGLTPQQTSNTVKGWNKGLNNHTLNTILEIGTAFIPVVGPFLSAGIGLSDAKLYYDEGDKKTAGLMVAFSMIPAVGGLSSKLGLTKWTAKALGEIGEKISLGKKLLPAEVQVANKVAKYKDLITTEMEKIGKTSTGKQNQSLISGGFDKIIPSGGFNKIIPQEIKSIIQKTPSIKVNDNVLNIIKNNIYDLKSGSGIISRLGRDIGNTTKMEYNSVDLSLKNLTQLEKIAKGQTLNVKSIIDNSYKSVYEIENLIKKFPKDRDLLWSAKSGILRFIDNLTPVLK